MELLKKYQQTKVFKNISALTISEVVIRAAKFILLALAARWLGPTDFGVFNYLLASAALIAVIGDFGINRIITRNVSQDQSLAKRYLGSFLVQLLLMIGYIAVATILLVLTHNVENLSLFILLAIFTTVNVLSDYLWSFFRATEDMVMEARAKSAQALMVLVSGIALLLSPWPLVGLGLAYLLGAVITFVMAWRHILSRYQVVFHLDFIMWRELVSKSWPIAIVAVSAFVFNQIDSIMLGAYGLLAEVGYYNAAYRIISGLLIPVFIINQVLFPKISRLSIDEGIKLVRQNVLVNFVIYALVVVGVGLFGEWVLGVVFGAPFKVAQQAFFILAMTLLLTAMVYPYSNYSIAKDYLKLNLWLSVLAAIMNIVLNWYLIPTYSYVGASVATLITYGFLLFGYVASLYWISRKN